MSFFYLLLFIFNFGFALNFDSFFDCGSAIVGLDMVSFNVSNSGLAAVGLDLVSLSSIS
jgi:hypothetical protein